MITPNGEIVVLDIAGSRAAVVCSKPSAEADLASLGFLQNATHWVRVVTDDADRQALVKALINLDALFSAGRDWSPAELLEMYREQGVVNEQYRVISWTGHGGFVVFTH